MKDSSQNHLDVVDPNSIEVTLSLLNSNGEVVAAVKPQLIDSSISVNSDASFTAELTGVDAKAIVVIISKAGFSDYARRINVEPNVSVTATLNKLQELTVETTQVTSISGKTVEGFNVSVNNSNGNEEIIEGSAGVADLSVSIPQSALPTGTTSVDVTMQAFNPNKLEEAESFPGAYEDSNGNKLLSVAFNYTDVKTDAGISLQKIAQDTRDSRLAAQKLSGRVISPLQFAKQKSQKTGVAAEPVIINRKIPQESCASLSQLGDANASLDGFQVPVYTYNTTNGIWDLLGYGTLFDEAGNKILADQKSFDCSVNTYVLEIEATNEIFLSNWWNLDYPLVFTQPVKLCADLNLIDEGNKPVVGSQLFLEDDDDLRSFSYENFVSDANGRVHIEVISLDGGADLSATAHIYGTSLYSGYTKIPVKLSTSCSMSADPVVVPLPIPEMCKLDGRVVNAAGSPLAKHYIIAADFSGEGTVIPGFALTDTDGRYHLSLQCKQKYQVIDLYSYGFADSNISTAVEANVNGTVGLSEVSDNGSVVVMKDLLFTSSKAFTYVAPTEDSLTQISVHIIYAGADFPLTYNFNVRGENDVVLGQYSGTVTKADFNTDDELGFSYAEIRINHNLTDEQIEDNKSYSAVGEIKDSKGNVSQITGAYVRESDTN